MKREKSIPTMSESAVHDNVAAIAPERIINNRLYEQLQTLQKVKLECGILYATYACQGVDVCRIDEITLYEDLDCCMHALSSLAHDKFLFDLQKGGAL